MSYDISAEYPHLCLKGTQLKAASLFGCEGLTKTTSS